MYDICCIGHITSDKIVNGKTITYQAGGTAWYFSQAMQNLDIQYMLVTALGQSEMHYVNKLRDKGVKVQVQPSTHTVCFENIYADNPDDRVQNVSQQADGFKMDMLTDVKAQIFHLGPLLADDISVEMIKQLANKGRVALDVQGYLRKVVNGKVVSTHWKDKIDALPYISILKADVAELRALTDCAILTDGIKQISDYGVKEIIITNGSKGSAIYADGLIYDIPAYSPGLIIDATGCGDTYMAGYLYRRVKGDAVQQAGDFATAMAALKLQNAGPFIGTEADVMEILTN